MMSGISLWQALILLCIFGGGIAIIGLIVWLAIKASKSNSKPDR